TFLGLIDELVLPTNFREQISRMRFTGNSAKLNLALSELPDFSALPGARPHLEVAIQIVGEGMPYLDRAYMDYSRGEPSSQPYIDLTLQSTVDDSLAPAGQHVASVSIKYVPRHPEGGWT